MEEDNPFPVNNYRGAKYFCDRKTETEQLLSALKNKRNILLYAPRRYGKTGLIKHVLAKSARAGYRTIFVDVFSANNLEEFNQLFLQAVVDDLQKKNKNFFNTIGQTLKNLRPTISFDPLNGTPNVSIEAGNEAQQKKSLTEIFNLLRAQKENYHIAIDEFQQIMGFKTTKTEALIRTEVQQAENLNFIFSGSQRHILLPMFNDAQRPFFGSTDFLKLEKIEPKVYARFIIKMFAQHGRTLSSAQAESILAWSNTHTYYTQVVCNRLYGFGEKTVSNKALAAVFDSVIKEQDAILSSLRLILNASPNQWQLLKAVALEGKVSKPTGRDFLQKHKLASSAAVVASLKALEEKELLYVDSVTEEGKPIYEVYNPFFANWFRYR